MEHCILSSQALEWSPDRCSIGTGDGCDASTLHDPKPSRPLSTEPHSVRAAEPEVDHNAVARTENRRTIGFVCAAVWYALRKLNPGLREAGGCRKTSKGCHDDRFSTAVVQDDFDIDVPLVLMPITGALAVMSGLPNCCSENRNAVCLCCEHGIVACMMLSVARLWKVIKYASPSPQARVAQLCGERAWSRLRKSRFETVHCARRGQFCERKD